MDFLSGSIRLFEIAGITVRMHMLYVLWVVFQLVQSGDGWRDQIIFQAMLFSIILLHEFGHCFAARAVDGDARDILMWPLGGLAFAHAPMRPWPQFFTVLCGPLVNVALCLLVIVIACIVNQHPPLLFRSWWTPILPPLTGDSAWEGYAFDFFMLNQWIFMFNMLPIFPLDGGQLFRAIIWPWVGLRAATIYAAQVGLAGCFVLVVWAFQRREGFSMLIPIAIFSAFTCWQHLEAARRGMLAEEFTSVDPVLRDKRRVRGPLGRWFDRRRGELISRRTERPAGGAPTAVQNPNPGGWQRKLDEEEVFNAEVDRILAKVRAGGIASLSYVEQETLRQATRRRREDEERFSRGEI